MARSFTVKVQVPGSALGLNGSALTASKADRNAAADTAAGHLGSLARRHGGTLGEVRYTRRGNVKFTVTTDRDYSVDQVISVLNPLAREAGASNLDVQAA